MKFLYAFILVVGVATLAGCGSDETGSSGDDLKDLEEAMINDPAQGEVVVEQENMPEEAAGVGIGAQTYTLAEVAKHATPEDCWTVVDGKVANVTDWFGVHPGGDDNLALACGKDATTIFKQVAKHDPKGFVKFETFVIGSLSQ